MEVITITSEGIVIVTKAAVRIPCQCVCDCKARNPCDAEITAEDLLCDFCRKWKGRSHCHILSFLYEGKEPGE